LDGISGPFAYMVPMIYFDGRAHIPPRFFIPFVIYLWISGFKRMKKMNNASISEMTSTGHRFCKVKDYRPTDEIS
jgi:hypothetical protein